MIKCQHCERSFSRDDGRFRTHVAFCGRDYELIFWGKVNKDGPNGCWLWLGGKNKGYGRICLRQKFIYAHRYAYELLVRKLREDEWCLHKCDNPGCVNPDHLFVGDNAANVADKVAKRRHTIGERNSHAKLNEKDVREILRLRGLDDPSAIGERYGIRGTSVQNIWARRSWKHIEEKGK